MPFVFVVLGLLFLVTAIRGTQGDMFALLKSELWGHNSFVVWAAAIMILGAIGYAKPVRPVADAMIGLVFLVMILANRGGFFQALNSGLRNPVAPNGSNSVPAPVQMSPPAPQVNSLGQSTPGSNTRPWWQNMFGASPAY